MVACCQLSLEYLIADLSLHEDAAVQLRMRDLAGGVVIGVQAVRDVVVGYQAEP